MGQDLMVPVRVPLVGAVLQRQAPDYRIPADTTTLQGEAA